MLMFSRFSFAVFTNSLLLLAVTSPSITPAIIFTPVSPVAPVTPVISVT